MRPLRFLLTLATTLLAFTLLLTLPLFRRPTTTTTTTSTTQTLLTSPSDPASDGGHTSLGTYFDWRTPSSLFPPSAVISLTDDNSTFFLARPAAFGPTLPGVSLSAALWVGSGFGDERLGRGSEGGVGVEGELGCSDVPGWDLGDAAGVKEGGERSKRWIEEAEEEAVGLPVRRKGSDGTDDHLHRNLADSGGVRKNGKSVGGVRQKAHADIQSLQEGAEIAGKVVLLSRGGCGFLEKVKWVQRRGGVALIVGDDIRGGPLVTMYARGDTSNVSIPSLFTSHTTAHLLSSLVPFGSSEGVASSGDAGRLGLALGGKKEGDTTKPKGGERPVFTTTTAAAVKSTANPNAASKERSKPASAATSKHDDEGAESLGWLRSIFSRKNPSLDGDDRRPPASGNVGRFVQKDFDEDEGSGYGWQKPSTSTSAASTKTPDRSSGDGFRIGVQDWRDPDLVAEQKEQLLASTSAPSSSAAAQRSHIPGADRPQGGSITPGSGEYAKAAHDAVDLETSKKPSRVYSAASKQSGDVHAGSRGWLSQLLRYGKDEELDSASAHDLTTAESHSSDSHTSHSADSQHRSQTTSSEESETHEGLWVTLTPQPPMSSSPFFDTLCVLVVSPLVTLTVVYALLLLRSRIRRRRWRAPKSVVERLPVRTYQTMASSANHSSPSSVISSPTVTATTPLLPSTSPTTASRPINPRSRPRSRTTSEVSPQPPGPSSMRSDGMAPPSLEHVEEKRTTGLSEWRRRYGGKQRECVVCLEEYIDGVSRVMSLPCGHEFHAECITPWLTTRRRTCPICKGDVVRSLGTGAPSSAPQSHSHSPQHGPSSQPPPPTELAASAPEPDAPIRAERPNATATESEVQEQAAVARNADPGATRPVSREDEAFEDLERGGWT